MVGRYPVVGIGCNLIMANYMHTPFVYNPQRNAWKAIKGFYHQVEVTTIRWLELQADTVLHCECGEDIDHVKQLLDTDGAIPTRLLEQIKCNFARIVAVSFALSLV
jgi:hypothetical protein